MQLQDYRLPIKKLNQQLESDPNNVQILLQLAELYLKSEDENYINAVVTLDKILELQPENLPANKIRSLIYKEEDNYEKAADCLKIILDTYNNAKDHPLYLETLFDYADILECLDKHEEAFPIYQELISFKPHDLAILFKMAHLYEILEKFTESINTYNKILELEPDNEVALSQLINLYETVDKKLYYQKKAELSVKEKNFNRAISEYKKMMSETSSSDDNNYIHKRIAEVYLFQEDYNHALDEYNLALDCIEDDDEAYRGMGRVYLEIAEFENALEFFNKAMSLNKKDPTIYIELAETYIELQKYPEAIGVLKVANQYRPDDINVKCSIAESYIAIGDNYNAKNEIDQVLTMDENNTRALGALIDLYLSQEHYEMALEISKKLVQIIPKSPFSSRKMAEVYELLKDDYHAHFNYALAYELQGEKGMAIDEYLQTISFNPKNADIHIKIGDLYIEMGEQFVGMEYYDKAVEIDPQNELALNKLAEFYFKHDEYEKAADAYLSLTKINSKDSDAYFNLGLIYEKQKYYEDALKAYYKFVELAPNSNQAYNVSKKISSFERKLNVKPANESEETDDNYIEYDNRTIVQKLIDFFKK